MKKYAGYALITGGDMGIGASFAEQLAEHGYDLLLVARNKELLTQTQESIRDKYGVKVLILSQDLTDPEATSVVMDFVKKQGIHISLLVNNAGFMNYHEFKDSDIKADVGMIDLMCKNMVELTYAVLPAMLEKGEGGIIINSSIASRLHIPYYAVYAGAKSFEESFGVILNYELKPKGIDVLVVCPGFIQTRFWEEGNALEGMTKASKSIIGLQPHGPDEVARKTLAALGHRIVLHVGGFMDWVFFYTSRFMPLKIERGFMHWYLARYYDIKY